jgi:arsenite-transporting ATPase
VRHLLDHRLLFFAGKGGVGKTTCASAVALAASQAGKRVLLVSTDPAHSTSDMFEQAFTGEEREIRPRLWGLEVDAESEVGRYLEQVKQQIGRLFSPAVLREATRQIEMTATMPGVADVALFDRMSDVIVGRRSAYDLVVFDTAPTGHTLRLLQMPEMMGAWIDALARRRRALNEMNREIAADGPPAEDRADPVLEALERRGQKLGEVRQALHDARTAAFVFVLLAERLPIEETARALSTLRAGHLHVGGLIVNRVLPDDLEGEFYRARREQERVYREEIDRRFADVPRVVVPQFASDVHGVGDLARVAAELQLEPAGGW